MHMTMQCITILGIGLKKVTDIRPGDNFVIEMLEAHTWLKTLHLAKVKVCSKNIELELDHDIWKCSLWPQKSENI